MLGIIGNRFSIGRETYHPFSAELHYFRIEKRYWSICFERIKRAGFRIISTAVPWNIHQDSSKHFDFGGYDDPNNDLIVFLELAREFGFKVILRPGPWVAGQLPYGGLPKYLFNDIKIFARDAKGQERKLSDDYGVETGYLPSYLHPNFQYHLKSYFKAFIETTKNYVHPRGPIFMVELDYETSFARQLDPDSADYNPDVIAKYYPPYLEGIYGDIKKLNAQYKEKNADFAAVEPPRQFSGLDMKDYPKVTDWFKFRQWMLNTYLEQLEDIFKAYTVEPLIFRSLYFRSGDLLSAFDLVPSDRQPFLGSNVFPEGNYFDLMVKARFLKAEYGFAFASSFASGAAAAEPNREEQVAPITGNRQRFYLAAGLAAGFKGMNHYMFVDRDRWYGAPLHNDGTISEGYNTARRFNQVVTQIGLEQMDNEAQIAVVGNRLYSWLAQTSSPKSFVYMKRLLYDSTVGFLRDLMRLKLNFGIRENKNFETLKNYKMVVIPSAEIMAESDQEAIVELAKAGVTVVLIGLMPKYDENFKDCQILANHFRIKTTVEYRIGNITHKNGSFPGYIYGSIRSTDDSKVKKLVKSDTKVVGVCSSRFKGNLYLLSFDIGSGGNHQKLSFVESLLTGEKIESYLYCSDPAVDVSFQNGEKRGLLFVVAPPAGELSDGFEAGEKEIIIKADLRAAGFKSANLRLTNVFAGEEDKPVKMTAKELRDGIPLTIQYPDGLIFAVDKR
ncbi:MAG: beta-galactosidase [Candidatus Zixiibacteriota bacterium]